MAVYDNNGTANAEIGKLYDDDGTTNYQIGKVYDNNGTTDSLVYNADFILFQANSVNNLGAWSQQKTDPNGVLSNFAITSNGYLSTEGPQSGTAKECFNGINSTPIDCSSFSKMIVTIVYTCAPYHNSGYYIFGLSTTKSASSTPNMTKRTNCTVGTHTIDISSLTGTYYFNIAQLYCDNGIQFSLIKFE